MSNQARNSLSLLQIDAQHHKLAFEMAALREMRRELHLVAQSVLSQKTVDDLHSCSLPNCAPMDHYASV